MNTPSADREQELAARIRELEEALAQWQEFAERAAPHWDGPMPGDDDWEE